MIGNSRALLTLLVVAFTPMAAQAPAGYHLGELLQLPDSLREVRAEGRFRAEIVRTARDPGEVQLIESAERLTPDRITILRADSGETRGPLLESLSRAAAVPGDRWWYTAFDSTWTPFAVTGAAVTYYLGRLRVLSERDGLFAEKLPAGAAKHHGELRYTASVSRADSAGVAYVVHLTLRWSYWCGMLCAMHFEQTRLVLFDAAGKIIRVQGDGKPSVIVS
jgi:hypothetical protein